MARAGDLDPDRSGELVDALVAIADDLDVDATLRRTVRTARRVVGARFGALGVLDRSGDSLAQFIHDGIDHETATAIGHLPTGHGLLGALIRDPRPLRVDSIAAHSSSVGLPPHHPPMSNFLGVPVRVGGEVFGNLYLSEKDGGFTEADERTLTALAMVAGTAIRNAGAAARLASRELLQRALAEIATAALAGAGTGDLLMTVSTAVTGLLPGATATIETSGAARDLDARPADDGRWCRPVGDRADSPVLVVDVDGVSAWRRSSAAAEALTTLCHQAGVALRYAEARAEVRRLAISGERDRIARDLHDTVIQRLFGAGLQLDALTRRIDDAAAEAVEQVITEVDAAIGELRSTIGRLDAPPARDLVDRLDAVVGAMAPACPPLAPLTVEGDLDDLPDAIAVDIPAVLREGIANAARHSSAATIVPRVVVLDGHLEVSVTDDGVGPGAGEHRDGVVKRIDGHGDGLPPTQSLGLRNLAVRARRHGGTSSLERLEPHGSRLVWRVPRT